MNLRQHLLNRISDLDRNILNLGIYVNDALKKAITALKLNNLEMAKEVIDEDTKINTLEMSIQDDIILLIAKEQPVAGDLRHVITSFKNYRTARTNGRSCGSYSKRDVTNRENGIYQAVDRYSAYGRNWIRNVKRGS